MYRLSLVVPLLLLPLPSFAARIVNVQPAASRGGTDGLSGEVSGSLRWTTGNTEVTELIGTAGVLWIDGANRIYFAGRSNYSLDDGEAFINQTFEHLRYRRRFQSWLSGESFVQHEYDEFRRLSLRALLGVGPRFDLPVPPELELAFGTAPMLEYERYTTGPESDSGEELLHVRWSNYVYASVALDKAISATHTTYLQPRFDDFSDYRLLSETSLAVQGNAWLGVKLSFVLAYDSRPPDEVEKRDTALTTALVFRI